MLLYFILGIVFIYVCVPVIDNLLTIFSTWAEYISYKFATKVYIMKQQLGIIEQEEEEKSNPIGFSTECIGYQTEDSLELEQEEE